MSLLDAVVVVRNRLTRSTAPSSAAAVFAVTPLVNHAGSKRSLPPGPRWARARRCGRGPCSPHGFHEHRPRRPVAGEVEGREDRCGDRCCGRSRDEGDERGSHATVVTHTHILQTGVVEPEASVALDRPSRMRRSPGIPRCHRPTPGIPLKCVNELASPAKRGRGVSWHDRGDGSPVGGSPPVSWWSCLLGVATCSFGVDHVQGMPASRRRAMSRSASGAVGTRSTASSPSPKAVGVTRP